MSKFDNRMKTFTHPQFPGRWKIFSLKSNGDVLLFNKNEIRYEEVHHKVKMLVKGTKHYDDFVEVDMENCKHDIDLDDLQKIVDGTGRYKGIMSVCLLCDKFLNLELKPIGGVDFGTESADEKGTETQSEKPSQT